MIKKTGEKSFAISGIILLKGGKFKSLRAYFVKWKR